MGHLAKAIYQTVPRCTPEQRKTKSGRGSCDNRADEEW